MMLKGKVAVIYAGGGASGGAVAHACGGSAEAAEVDALDEQAVYRHLQ
jgi:hypothetical protein